MKDETTTAQAFDFGMFFSKKAAKSADTLASETLQGFTDIH